MSRRNRSTLTKIAAQRASARLDDQLGRADRDRLAAVVGLLADDGRATLSDVLRRCFPHLATSDALTVLRQFRQRLGAAADAAGIGLSLEADRHIKSDPASRRCWFVGEDHAAEEAANYSRGETRDVAAIRRVPQGARVIDTRGGRQVVRYFVSYARADIELKEKLMGLLRARLDNAAEFVFVPWDDGDIVAGEDWATAIDRALAVADLGLLLVSNEFLRSEFITRVELPRFVDGAARGRAIPVGLEAVPLDGSADLKGLEQLQIYRQDAKWFFDEKPGGVAQRKFVDGLVQQIVRYADRYLAASGPTPGRDTAEILRRDQADSVLTDEERRAFILTRGVPTSLDILDLEGRRSSSDAGACDVLDFLDRWIADPHSPVFCALLGEYGMGKTTTCKAFTQRLLEAHAKDPSKPLPIYLDLRHLGEVAKRNPMLPEILSTVLERSWKGGSTKQEVTPDEVVRLVRDEGAVVLFDGLDEVLVHLSTPSGQQFTRELWRVLPPPQAIDPARAGAALSPVRRGKLLISCRTHYFRSLRDQRTHLTGEGREPVASSDYRAIVLLPFNDEQVGEYLRRNFPADAIGRVRETIRSVHNLTELAGRPYLLQFITTIVPRLEQWRAEGRSVTSVTLYEEMVNSWLSRDDGKHQLTPGHKKRLMAYFAAELWRSGRQSWSVDDVEQWLVNFLAANPEVAAHYTDKSSDVLKEDLRTATFLVREGDDQFRFAHSSLFEFFLARRLHRTLVEGRIEVWNLPVPSPETLVFLGEMIASEERDACFASLRTIRARYRPRASELALACVLRAVAHGIPTVSLVGFGLDGAKLRGLRIEGSDDRPLLDMSGATLAGADLREARFRRVRLDGAHLGWAKLGCALVEECSAVASRWVGADLVRAVFRATNLAASDFSATSCCGTQVLDCGVTGLVGLNRDSAGLVVSGDEPMLATARPAKSRAVVRSITGHSGPVNACAYSPDGARVVSAGDDGTVRVWDAASGDEVLTLRGHEGSVLDCEFSPSGAQVVSAGDDGTVRLWDAARAGGVLVLGGPGMSVQACAYSPDGTRVVAAGTDGKVRVWDAASGMEVLVLRGHEEPVRACGFSPDGVRVLSAGDDGTVRVWDAASGSEVLVLRGNGEPVRACGFSPDGARIVSTGDRATRLWDAVSGEFLASLGYWGASALGFSPDGARVVSVGDRGIVRLWDAATGETDLDLSGHKDVHYCRFSPDGQRFVSAGHDGSVRLWDAGRGEELLALRGHEIRVGVCEFSPDGSLVATAGDDGTVRLWNVRSGEEILALRGHEGRVVALGLSPDRTRIVSAGHDRTVRFWDCGNGEEVLALRAVQRGVHALAFSPDGTRVVSVEDDGAVRLWNAASGEELGMLRGHEVPVLAGRFSPDGTRIVSGEADGTLRLWDATTGREVLVLRGNGRSVRACGFSRDGRRVLSAGHQTVSLWDVESAEEILTLSCHVWTACALSPDGSRVVSARSNGTVGLWDAASGEELGVLRGHEGPVLACVFSPDGSRVGSTGLDGTVRLWDTASGREVGFRIHHLPEGEAAVLAPDGSAILGASPGAWRWLGWIGPDPVTGAMTRYPAETYGPLPPLGRGERLRGGVAGKPAIA